jgi:hypothetical protein
MYISDNVHLHIRRLAMNDTTHTSQRKKLFRVTDRVLATGAPVRIRCGARVLTLSADSGGKGSGRLARLKRRNLIVGDASTLWKVKAGGSRYRATALKPR